MFPKSIFPKNVFSGSVFLPLLVALIITPPVDNIINYSPGGSSGTIVQHKYKQIDNQNQTIQQDDDEIIELITMLFQMGMFNE